MASEAAKTLPCPSCQQENELPFVFCEKCGSTGLKLSRLRVTYNLSLTFAVVMGGVYFRDFLYDAFAWNWPLYLLIAVFFTQFAVALTRGQTRSAILVNWWCALFLGGGFAFFFFLHRDDLGIVFVWLADAPHDAIESPGLYGSVLGGVLLLGLLPIYLRWRKRYGYVNAYRIILLSLLALCVAILAVLRILQKINDSDLFGNVMTGLDAFIRDSKPGYITCVVLLASVLARLFLFEIVIFSALRGLVVTRSVHASIAAEADLKKETGFTRSLVHIVQTVNRLLLILDNMVRYLFETLLILAKDLAEVALAFVRELLVPALVLSGATVLCHVMTFCIDNYIFEYDLDAFLKASGALAGMLLCAMIFLACKTPVSWRRTAVFYFQLMGWLLPNLLVFFLLLSVSLYFSSAAYNRVSNGDHTLPFRVGILTKSVGGFLLVLILITLVRKRSVLLKRTDGAAPAGQPQHLLSGPQVEAAEPAGASALRPGETPAREKPAPRPEETKGLVGGLKEKLRSRKETMAESVRRKSEALGLDRPARYLFEAGRELADRLRGKPAIVEQLAQIQAICEQKMGEIRALEATRDSISPETYEELYEQYEEDMEGLIEARDDLQPQADKMYAEETVRKNKAETDLKIYTHQAEEAERLFEAGALSEKDLKKRTTELKARIQMAEVQLKNHERMLGYLAPVAGRSQKRPSARPPQPRAIERPHQGRGRDPDGSSEG